VRSTLFQYRRRMSRTRVLLAVPIAIAVVLAVLFAIAVAPPTQLRLVQGSSGSCARLHGERSLALSIVVANPSGRDVRLRGITADRSWGVASMQVQVLEGVTNASRGGYGPASTLIGSAHAVDPREAVLPAHATSTLVVTLTRHVNGPTAEADGLLVHSVGAFGSVRTQRLDVDFGVMPPSNTCALHG
jgi:hypothetical protein